MVLSVKQQKRRQIAGRLFMFFALVLVVFGFSAISKAELLPVKTYTVADGLLRDSVSKIKQDSRGFLWFCTLEGISRFDGVGITNFTVADGLPDRFVQDFLETRNGTLYIATHKGLARLNPHGLRGSRENPLFTTFLPDNPKAEKILTFYEDKSGQIWVGTSDGLYKLIETGNEIRFEIVRLGNPLDKSGGAIAEPSPNTLAVNTILEDRRGMLWIGTYGSGLYRLSADGKVRQYTTSDGFGDNKITDLLEDRNGRLWMSMRNDDAGGLCLLNTGADEKLVQKCYTEKDGLGSNWIRDMLETSDGQIWLATVPGLCRFQVEGGESVCKTYSAKNNLCDDMLALAEDKDGNLWTGSSCGAKKIARFGFTTYKTSDGLNYDYVNSIFENPAGELFVTTYPKDERVVSRFDGEKFTSVKPRLPDYVKYHGWGWQRTVLQDKRGAWWIASGGGLFRSPDNTDFTALARAPLDKQETGAEALEVFRLFEDSRGDIWLFTTGTAYELFHWERAANRWRNFTAQVGFSFHRVGMAIVEDKHGNVWIGAASDHNDSALIRYRRGEFRVFSQAEGAPSNWIQDLFLDSRGRLWIASDNEGLWRLDDTDSDNFEFVKYSTVNGLTSNATASVTEDEFGRIYIGTWRGIDRLNPETGQIENFTTADGLPSSFVEVSFRDRQKNLWFGTDEGVARFIPEPPRQRNPPTMFITGLRVNGEPQNISILGETSIKSIVLQSDQRQVTVDFLGLGASLGEKLKYEYRFGGTDWTTTVERTLNFANLAAGDYRLEIRAQTADRLYSRSADFSFKIAAPLWQRWWFLFLATIAVGSVIYLIYKYRLGRLLELEKVRTRIATDLHDDIGANLTRISLLSEVAKQKSENGNGKLLNSIADIARESVASMNDIVWAISPDHDSFLDLTRRMRAHAEEIFAFREIELEFNAADSALRLSVGMRRDLLLIFKEAVNNAAKHSGCQKVSINFGSENSILRLAIKDDGKGFETAEIYDGQGLRSMSNRARSLGGELNIESMAGAGTQVKFKMQLAKKNFKSRL